MSTSNLAHVLSVSPERTPFLPFLYFPATNSPGLSHVISPDIGCGLWHPEADALATLREDIDENAGRWKEVLKAPAMRHNFLNGAPDDDDAVVSAFVHHNRDSALKTKPKVWSVPVVAPLSFDPARTLQASCSPGGSSILCMALRSHQQCLMLYDVEGRWDSKEGSVEGTCVRDRRQAIS